MTRKTLHNNGSSGSCKWDYELVHGTLTSVEMLFLALSPTALFVAYPPAFGCGVETVLATLVRGHDLLLLRSGCSCVYASQKVQDWPDLRIQTAVYDDFSAGAAK